MRPAVVKVCNQLNLTRVWVTPFFRVTEHVPKLRELTTFMKSFEPDSHRVILQIMGTDAERLAETALRAMEAGAAGIDLNCGCPSHQVVAHGAGAGSLKNIPRTTEIIRAMRKKIGDKVFFSIKTRLGFDRFTECQDFLPRWQEAGHPDMFTLHYRTAREGYLSVAGRDERLRAARLLLDNSVLVFGNGDIAEENAARQLAGSLALDGTMIGRAFWRDPFMLKRAFEQSQVNAVEGRKILWEKLSALPMGEDAWGIGSAIEMASLILGANSPEAEELKKRFPKRR